MKNYNLPHFILEKVAQDCNSELIKKGRIEDRLQSMNDTALELLHRVFVDCAENASGLYANYRFFAYISSMFHKCEILLNENEFKISFKEEDLLKFSKITCSS